MALYGNMERFFPSCSHKQKETSLAEPVPSIKLVCNLKHLFVQAVS